MSDNFSNLTSACPGGPTEPTSTPGASTVMWRRGDRHPETGMRFVSYRKKGYQPPGKERWMSEDAYWAHVARARKNLTEWRRKNPEKVLVQIASTTARNKDKILARKSRYRKQNTERIRKYRKKYYEDKGDVERANHVRWTQENAKQVAEYRRKRWETKPQFDLANCAVRRARKAKTLAPDRNDNMIRQFYATARRISKCLGIPFHVDHLMPLARGGKHHENNLRVIPAKINRLKGAKIVYPLVNSTV